MYGGSRHIETGHCSGPARGCRVMAVAGVLLGLMAGAAAAQPHVVGAHSEPPRRAQSKLPVGPHATDVRYAYVIGGMEIRLDHDCGPHKTLLRIRIQVHNLSENRIALPVMVKVQALSGRVPDASAPVPSVMPGGSTWVAVSVPYPQTLRPGMARLRVVLAYAGQAWGDSRLQTFVSPALCGSAGAAHAPPMHAGGRSS